MYPSFLDAIDKRINGYTYRIKKVATSNGHLYEQPEGDEGVEFILTWKGTGEKKRFMDILREYVELGISRANIIKSGKKPEAEHLWLVEYIAKKNYQITFEPDDIMLRHRYRAK